MIIQHSVFIPSEFLHKIRLISIADKYSQGFCGQKLFSCNNTYKAGCLKCPGVTIVACKERLVLTSAIKWKTWSCRKMYISLHFLKETVWLKICYNLSEGVRTGLRVCSESWSSLCKCCSNLWSDFSYNCGSKRNAISPNSNYSSSVPWIP